MLMVTEDAAVAIRGLIEMSPNPVDAGLRIASRPEAPHGEPPMELTISDEPALDDIVVEVGDTARIYLDPVMAPVFETKVLHAEEDDGRVRFLIADQIGEGEDVSRNGSRPEA